MSNNYYAKQLECDGKTWFAIRGPGGYVTGLRFIDEWEAEAYCDDRNDQAKEQERDHQQKEI